jgi:prepilin-type N-terminal cleavage/methylation domain-containing protein
VKQGLQEILLVSRQVDHTTIKKLIGFVKNNMKKGFTLIELLVVIAIVGILASVILGAAHSSSTTDQPTVGKSEEVLPEPTNFAVDTSGTLTPEQLTALNAKLKDLSVKAEIAVAMVSTTGSLSIEEYGIRLAEKWKVGKEGIDNGAIIIIATQDRKLRIEVGKGLEGDITDSVAGSIIRDDMVPMLKAGDWYGAVNKGIDSINSKIK